MVIWWVTTRAVHTITLKLVVAVASVLKDRLSQWLRAVSTILLERFRLAEEQHLWLIEWANSKTWKRGWASWRVVLVHSQEEHRVMNQHQLPRLRIQATTQLQLNLTIWTPHLAQWTLVCLRSGWARNSRLLGPENLWLACLNNIKWVARCLQHTSNHLLQQSHSIKCRLNSIWVTVLDSAGLVLKTLRTSQLHRPLEEAFRTLSSTKDWLRWKQSFKHLKIKISDHTVKFLVLSQRTIV